MSFRWFPRAYQGVCIAIAVALATFPVCHAVAQAPVKVVEESDVDEAAADAEAQVVKQRIEAPDPPSPAKPPTPPSQLPRKLAQVETNIELDLKTGSPNDLFAKQRAAALQEVMKALKKQQEQLAKQNEMLGKQQEQLAKQVEQSLKGGGGAPQQLFEWSVKPDQKRWEYTQALAAADTIKDAQGNTLKIVPTPLPPNAVLKAFKLQYVKPEEIGQALHNITGGGGPRVSIDERTNSLLIAGEDKQMGVVQQVIETLDQPAGQKTKVNDTLQVRVVWVLDAAGKEGKPAQPPYVSSDVLEGLSELGFESPRVMCQQVTTLTFGRERQGNFQFHIPVLAEGSSWQFTGDGRITPANDERYAIDFTLGLQQPNNTNDCQVGGSILTPLSHYTVMGTSTFVTAPSGDNSGAAQDLKQHLSAFVIYLDRSREFGEKEGGGKKK
jgi:hypothetical protein